jgi:hypothetical protein
MVYQGSETTTRNLQDRFGLQVFFRSLLVCSDPFFLQPFDWGIL